MVLRENLIYLVVIVITSLLLIDVVLTRSNNRTLKKNKEIQIETQRVKFYFDQIGKVTIHSLDIGLRGFAIIQKHKLVKPMYFAVIWRDSIFRSVELPLARLGYDTTSLREFKDSLNGYIKFCYYLKSLIEKGDREEFLKQFEKDKGGPLWIKYLQTEKEINSFLERINNEAEQEYNRAMSRNHLLQIILIVISIPTLLYTAFYTKRSFILKDKVSEMVEEKNKILLEQNTFLEKSVKERTQEIIAQNEELVAQSEEISSQRDTLVQQNKQLQQAQDLIEAQNKDIRTKNDQLETQVDIRTTELRNANQQLIEHNNQLEQFSFITAHNLRAPLARILGLANVLQLSNSVEEKEKVYELMVNSSFELDKVIKDLNVILDIRKHTGNFVEVDLRQVSERVTKVLEQEINDTEAKTSFNFDEGSQIRGVPPYIESILYNLLSNSLKYRDPNRRLEIEVKTIRLTDYLCLIVKDNGLGIDLNKYSDQIFNLYKRFHFHMEGKGLGLYLIKTQIMALQGKIEVESIPGTGTSFKVFFKA